MTTKKTNKKKISLAAIDQTVILNHSSSAEYLKNGIIYWGIDNHFPNDLYEAYLDSPTLHTLVDGIAAYVGSSDAYDIERIAFQLVLYGAAAIQVFTRGKTTYRVLDWQYLRLKDDGTAIYSLKFGKNTKRSGSLNLALYDPTKSILENDESVLIMKQPSFQTYPIPTIGSAMPAVKTEILISRFHYNSVNNGFAGDLIVNFNNGQPDDEIKAEIERTFINKFNGVENAASVMFSWNDDKDHSVSVEHINADNNIDKFKEITSEIKQQIFTAFRVNPNIFGIPTEGTGFAGEEYEQSFKLFMKNIVVPTQNIIAKGFNKINIDIQFNNGTID